MIKKLPNYQNLEANFQGKASYYRYDFTFFFSQSFAVEF